jgi:hypothetical protein
MKRETSKEVLFGGEVPEVCRRNQQLSFRNIDMIILPDSILAFPSRNLGDEGSSSCCNLLYHAGTLKFLRLLDQYQVIMKVLSIFVDSLAKV